MKAKAQSGAGIPGVTIMAFKQDRPLEIDPADGCVGALHSGHATVVAVVDRTADPTVGLFRDGQDHYIRQWDCVNEARTETQGWVRDTLLKGRIAFAPDPGYKGAMRAPEAAYAVKVCLQVDKASVVNVVRYPANMLVLAKLGPSPDGVPTGHATVWKVGLVSQEGLFFVTVHKAYEVRAYRARSGEIVFPRFATHEGLGEIIAEMIPDTADLPPESEFVREELPPLPAGCPKNGGIVTRWYPARGLGSILTPRGLARVHWTDVPKRPRLRHLVPGERVTFAGLGKPPDNPATEYRKMRRPRGFALQASGITLGWKAPQSRGIVLEDVGGNAEFCGATPSLA